MKIFRSKSFKIFICLFLCLSLFLSPVLETQANAVAIESWVIWAMITYLTSVGIVFTATGGAQAAYNALEEKANEYSTNVIDFYDIVRGGIKLVPPPNGGPEWNPRKGLFFFTANAAAAMTLFIDWLVSDGGWIQGNIYEDTSSISTFSCFINGVETVAYTCQGVQTTDINNVYTCDNLGTVIDVNINGGTPGEYHSMMTKDNFYYKLSSGFEAYFVLPARSTAGTVSGNANYYYGSGTWDKTTFYPVTTLQNAGYNNWEESWIGVTFIRITTGSVTSFKMCAVMSDGKIVPLISVQAPADFVTFTSSVSVDVPEEIPQINTLPSEGVLLDNEVLAAESLQELGELVENLFIDTGTIPEVQPQVITDPEYVPQPSPEPSPPVNEDVDDLGLPALGNALFNKFPFSLPKDVNRIFTILTADPVAPYWSVDLTGNAIGISSNFEIDFSRYEVLGQVSRWFSVITYTLFLILITKGVMKW